MKPSLAQSWIGSYHSIDDSGRERRAVLDLHAFPRSLLDPRIRVDGALHLDGMALSTSVSGRVAVRLFGARAIYDLSFRGDDRRPRRMHLEVEGDWRRPWTSLTTLVGRVYEGMLETHRVVLRASLMRSAKEQVRSLRGDSGP